MAVTLNLQMKVCVWLEVNGCCVGASVDGKPVTGGLLGNDEGALDTGGLVGFHVEVFVG